MNYLRNCYSLAVQVNRARFVNFESGPFERAWFEVDEVLVDIYSLRTLPDVRLAFWSTAALAVALTRATGSPSSLPR